MTRPDAARLDVTEPDAMCSGAARSAGRSGAVRFGAAPSDAVRSDAVRSDAVRSGAVRSAGRRGVRRVGAAVLATGAAFALAVPATAPPASAHTTLRSSDPAAGATVGDPGQITLTYADAVMVPQVVVTGPGGARVGVGAAHAVDNTVTQAVKTGLPGGVYTVGWRVVATDGHPITGSYTFTVSGAAGAPAAAPSASAEPAKEKTNSAGWLWVGLAAVVVAAIGGGVAWLRRSRRA
ncbi:copper resistance CopC family protein [Actinomadura atramentaria]|uniref:copper resistance CopC family protein n=1 Tax=Actinomadura atramentaria TaxID=1990 RepID=UPI0003A40552|nr:copper resistance protein CopC [Actinomadura atramentaria]